MRTLKTAGASKAAITTAVKILLLLLIQVLYLQFPSAVDDTSNIMKIALDSIIAGRANSLTY